MNVRKISTLFVSELLVLSVFSMLCCIAVIAVLNSSIGPFVLSKVLSKIPIGGESVRLILIYWFGGTLTSLLWGFSLSSAIDEKRQLTRSERWIGITVGACLGTVVPFMTYILSKGGLWR